MTGTSIVYDYASFTLSNGESDYDVGANVAALFNRVPVAKKVSILFDQNISIKLNNTVLPAIDLTTDNSPFQLPDGFLEVTNIYLTNASGSDATVKILLA